jgi:GTP pyrophosphokinase
MSLSSQFEQALIYAANAHATQVRKGTATPYMAHLLGVCSIALEYGANETEAIAALLHDAVEDQGGLGRLEDIRSRFGNDVAEIVMGCTDSFQTPKPPWEERKRAYLAHLPSASGSILLISASDKLYNAQATLRDLYRVGNEIWKRFNVPREKTLWYYRALVNIYLQVGPARLNDELGRVVAEMERVAASSSAISS